MLYAAMAAFSRTGITVTAENQGLDVIIRQACWWTRDGGHAKTSAPDSYMATKRFRYVHLPHAKTTGN